MSTEITNSIPPELLAELENTFSNFSAIAVVVFLVFVAWGAFQGFRRSIFRQVVHVAITGIIAFIAFSVVSNFTSEVYNEFQTLTMADLIIELESAFASEGIELPKSVISILEQYDMATLGYVFAIFFNTLVAPFMFAVLFGIIGIVGKIVTSVVCFFVPKGKSLAFRLVGIAGGVVEGALIAGVVLLPLVGLVNVSGTVVNEVRNSETDDETLTQVVEFYDEAVVPLENHVIFQTVGSLGGDAALQKLATVEFNGEEKNLYDEYSTFTSLGLNIVKLTAADFKAIAPEHKDALDGLIDSTTGSPLISDIILGAANGLGVALGGGDDEATIPIVLTNSDYAGILDEIATVLANTDADDLNKNLHTIADLYYLLSDEGIILMFTEPEDGGDITVDENALGDALMKVDENGKTVINRAIDIIDENENMRQVVSMLGELSVKLLYKELGIEGDAAEAYDTVSTGVKNVLSIETEGKEKAEVQTEVSTKLEETLESINIHVGEGEGQISSEALDVMSGYIADELMSGRISIGEDGEVTDGDVLNVLLSYYQSITE
ncbi:MAG: hypothetical protein IJW61_01555 [Clostridia bacterium]|nr:hypothetical protein [Clostridia bacterium]